MESEASKEPPVTLREGMRGVWRHVREYKGTVILLSVLGIISAIANGAVPYVTGRFFDSLVALSRGQTLAYSGLPYWVLMLAIWAAIQIIANGIDFVLDRKRRKIDSGLQPKIQAAGFVHLLKLPLTYHANEQINAVVSKMSYASYRISSIVENTIQIVPQFLSVIIGIVLAASISLPMAGVLASGVLVYVILLAFILRPVAVMEHTVQQSWGDMWDDAAAAVQQAATVKQSVAETYEIAKVRTNLTEKIPALWFSIQKIWSNVNFFQRSIVFVTQLVIFISSAHSVASGSMTIGDLIALNGYALLFFGPFVTLGGSWQVFQNGITSAGLIERVFNRVQENYHPKDARTAGETPGTVAFDDVTFRYEATHDPVLAHFSFAAQPGQSVAFVGESGVGKSTAVSLISGYYFPGEGRVTVDGVDTRQWDLTALRQKIAVVPQEVALFNDTIRTNIRYGTFDATDEQVEAAAREAHIHDFIEKQPEGYDTIVGERGIKLSVGQKQRLAIARAILRNPEFLILDEPTSALDPETERLVTESLHKLMEGRTTFVIAHRLSTVRKADLILVVKDGTVVERGSHDELMAITGGTYRHLYELHVGLHE